MAPDNELENSGLKFRYVLKQGKIISVEEIKPVELIALKEVRANEFDVKKINEKRLIYFDMDNDGRTDTVFCEFFHRSESLNWEIKFANKKVFKSNLDCKRIGVLCSVTYSYNDLVIDKNIIISCYGRGYN